MFDILRAARKVYEKMAAIEQSAIVNMSGVLAIINANLDQSGIDITAKIKEQYPDIDLDGLKQALCEVASQLQRTTFNYSALRPEDRKVENVVANIAYYLKKFSGDAWIAETKKLVTLLAKFYSPETPIQKFFDVLEFVYQDIVRPRLLAQAA